MEKKQVKYPTIEAYLRIKKKADDTFKEIYENLEDAITEGIKATGAYENAKPRQMETPEGRKKYEDAMVKTLSIGAKKCLKIEHELKDPIYESIALTSYIRIDRLNIRQTLEKLQGQANLDSMLNEFKDSLINTRHRLTMSTLEKLTNPKEVVAYTHTQGKVNMTLLEKDRSYLAVLIDIYLENGTVPDHMIREMPFWQERKGKAK